MKVDFHVHTAERSRCATAHQKEQIETAIAAGLDCIAITDHHKLVPLEELERLNRAYAPFRILGGIEALRKWRSISSLLISDIALG